jgi:hypothetical protein
MPELTPRHDAVVYLDNGYFELAQDLPGYEAHGALIFPVADDLGDIVDLCAWSPPRRSALWSACGCMLGGENLLAPRMREALAVHATPLEWLRDGCRGVVPIDWSKAAGHLRRAEPLEAASLAHGLEIEEHLRVRPVRILIPEAA